MAGPAWGGRPPNLDFRGPKMKYIASTNNVLYILLFLGSEGGTWHSAPTPFRTQVLCGTLDATVPFYNISTLCNRIKK